MKEQDKELLLKDLCARLPYGVFANYTSEILFRKSVVGRVYLWSSNGFYIKKIDKYPLKKTNIMLAEDLENGVEWELLIKKAMKGE